MKKKKFYDKLDVRVKDNIVNKVSKYIDLFFNLAPIGLTSYYGDIPEFHPELKKGEKYIFFGKINSLASLEQRKYIIDINFIVNIAMFNLLKKLAEKSTKFYSHNDSLSILYIERSISKKDFFIQQKWSQNKIRDFKKN